MRIVIAEDSAVIRAGLAEILADRGHVVVAAVGNAEDLQSAVDPGLALPRTGYRFRRSPCSMSRQARGMTATGARRRTHAV